MVLFILTKKQRINCTVFEQKKEKLGKDFKAELKKVIWPTPKQLAKSTMAVVFIVVVTAIIVFVLDVVFETIISLPRY